MAVQSELLRVFHLYGYQNIETPTFEFYDIFKKELSKKPLLLCAGDGFSLILRLGVHCRIAQKSFHYL